MTGRTIVRALLILVMALFASFSTVRATQVFSNTSAHAGYLSAKSAVSESLAQALNNGLQPSEIATYQAQYQRLQTTKSPPSNPWSTRSSDFYSHQASRYWDLNRQIKTTISDVTTQSRTTVRMELDALRGDIARARTLGLDTVHASAMLDQQKSLFHLGFTAGDFRAIASTLGPFERQFASRVRVRGAYITGLLRGSNYSVAGIVRQASQEVAITKNRLVLFGVFAVRAQSYGAIVDRLLDQVRSEAMPRGAALQAANLHEEVMRIVADFRSTVPHKVIVVSTEAQWLHLWEDGHEVYDSPVTTGGPDLPTYHGIFHINAKISPFTFHSPWGGDSPYYYPPTDVSYWMPFNGGEGLHDAWWRDNFGPGSNLSETNLGTGNSILGTHGCVNLPMDAASYIWDWAPEGTTVVVI